MPPPLRSDLSALVFLGAEELFDLVGEFLAARQLGRERFDVHRDRGVVELMIELIDDGTHVGAFDQTFFDTLAIRGRATIDRAEIGGDPVQLGEAREQRPHRGRRR